MPNIKFYPADEMAGQLLAQFSGSLFPEDFGFVYRFYDKDPEMLQDGFADGPIYGYRPCASFYPASVVKIFFMAAFFAQIKSGMLAPDEEDYRAVSDMITFSCNDATTYLLGRLTHAFNGPVLPKAEMTAWWNKRNWVQNYFDPYQWPEFKGIRICHSTYEEGPYGREKIARDLYGMNVLSPVAAAAIMHAIVSKQMVDAQSAAQMMALLCRDKERAASAETQGKRPGGSVIEALPDSFHVYSKSGATSWTRHDLVYAKSPDGRGLTIAAFTQSRKCAANMEILPFLTKLIVEQMS